MLVGDSEEEVERIVVPLYIHVYEKFLYPIATRLEIAVTITSGGTEINKINELSKVFFFKNNIYILFVCEHKCNLFTLF